MMSALVPTSHHDPVRLSHRPGSHVTTQASSRIQDSVPEDLICTLLYITANAVMVMIYSWKCAINTEINGLRSRARSVKDRTWQRAKADGKFGLRVTRFPALLVSHGCFLVILLLGSDTVPEFKGKNTKPEWRLTLEIVSIETPPKPAGKLNSVTLLFKPMKTFRFESLSVRRHIYF